MIDQMLLLKNHQKNIKMNRQLINQELERFGIPEDVYVGNFLNLFSLMSLEEAKKVGSVTINFGRSHIAMENQPDLEEGVIMIPEVHTDILRITEQGEFLERMKELAFGEFYSRFRYR